MAELALQGRIEFRSPRTLHVARALLDGVCDVGWEALWGGDVDVRGENIRGGLRGRGCGGWEGGRGGGGERKVLSVFQGSVCYADDGLSCA